MLALFLLLHSANVFRQTVMPAPPRPPCPSNRNHPIPPRPGPAPLSLVKTPGSEAFFHLGCLTLS